MIDKSVPSGKKNPLEGLDWIFFFIKNIIFVFHFSSEVVKYTNMRRARHTGKEQEKAQVLIFRSISLFSDCNQNNLTARKNARDTFFQSAE